MKANKVMRGQEVLNHRRRKDKKNQRAAQIRMHPIKSLNNKNN
jgi:hypothetical protein